MVFYLQTIGLGLEFYKEEVLLTVSHNVLDILQKLNIDPLGVSTDSLMLIVPPEISNEVIKLISNVGVPIKVVGEVINSGSPILVDKEGNDEVLSPLFREAAYTIIKKLVGETALEDFEIMKEKSSKSS